MTRKCGCATQKCACQFTDSDSITVSGIGASDAPFVVDRVLPLIVQDTSTLNLELNETSEGFLLSGFPLGTSSNLQVFATGGTWTKPAGVNMVRVLLIGGGGGGAGGATGSGIGVANGNQGAPGGAGGSVTIATLAGADIPSTATILIGNGGMGGPAGTTVEGSTGSSGSATAFSYATSTLYAGGGGGGSYTTYQGGQPSATGNVPGGAGPVLIAGLVYQNEHPYLAPAGGGLGAPANGDTYSNGRPGAYSLAASGCRDLVDRASTGNGYDDYVTFMGTGGAGAPFYPAVAGNPHLPGYNGGLYGGGGGGGASGTATPGGNGAPGVVVVMAW